MMNKYAPFCLFLCGLLLFQPRITCDATPGDPEPMSGDIRRPISAEDLRLAIAAGGVIHVAAGNYVVTEALVADRPISLVMEPGALIVVDWSNSRTASALRLTAGADGSQLTGVRIDGQGNSIRGVTVENVTDVRIKDLFVTDTGHQGLWIQSCQRVIVQDVFLTRTQTHEDANAGAIRTQNSSDVVIERARVDQTGGKGIAFGNSRRCVVRDSTVQRTELDAGDGIYFNNSHDCLVIGSHVIDPQGNALKISRRSSRIMVRDCVLRKENRGVGRTLFIQGGLDNQVSGSHLIGRHRGSTVQVSGHPRENVGGPALRNRIHGNHIVSEAGIFFGEGSDARDSVYEDNIELHAE